MCVPGEADAPLPGVLNDTFRINFHRDYVQSAMQAVALDKVRAHGCLPFLAQSQSCGSYTTLTCSWPHASCGMTRCVFHAVDLTGLHSKCPRLKVYLMRC